jgi:hypothetical protein
VARGFPEKFVASGWSPVRGISSRASSADPGVRPLGRNGSWLTGSPSRTPRHHLAGQLGKLTGWPGGHWRLQGGCCLTPQAVLPGLGLPNPSQRVLAWPLVATNICLLTIRTCVANCSATTPGDCRDGVAIGRTAGRRRTRRRLTRQTVTGGCGTRVGRRREVAETAQRRTGGMLRDICIVVGYADPGACGASRRPPWFPTRRATGRPGEPFEAVRRFGRVELRRRVHHA